MTISLAIKVNDGLVLAADSATTMVQYVNGAANVTNVYNNANKVFQLHKDIPVGAVTWGLGNIAESSISTLVKEFRASITQSKNDINPNSYTINPNSYSVEEIVHKFFDFIYSQKYIPASAQGSMGFIIGGYSALSSLPENWKIFIEEDGTSQGPILVHGTTDPGMYWDGQPEAISRLISGTSYLLPSILDKAQIPHDKIKEIMYLCRDFLQAPVLSPAMPIQDAIDLADYLIDTTIKYVKYTPGHQTVGGPIEIAVITKYEGMKWIKRKHYYSKDIN